jgi:hypothetical protein
MPAMNQPSCTSLHRPLLLLVLTGALGACAGESTVPGLLLFDRDAHDFGQRQVGESSDERVFTVRNAGSAELDGLGVRVEPAGSFDVLGTTCAGRLQPGATCTITVAFTPARAGAAQADLVVEATGVDASAALAGVGAVTVRVVNNAAGGAIVESVPAGIRCGAACEATFTVSEIVLSVAGEGTGLWSQPCQITPEGDCALALQGAAVITLQGVAGVQWTFGTGGHGAIATDARNNVIAISDDEPSLFRLSPDGARSWQVDGLAGASAVAADAAGNVGVIDSASNIRKYDSAGRELWSVPGSEVGIGQAVDLAFHPSGALLVAGTGGEVEGDVVQLVKLGGAGNVQWSRTYAPEVVHLVTGLAVDGLGDVVISGRGSSQPAPGAYDFAFVRKYDTDGAFRWQVAGLAGELTTDAAGNVFVAAELRLHGYSPDGDVLWDAPLGDGVTAITALAVTPAGDVIAAGTRASDTGAAALWVAQFEGGTGARRRPFELPAEEPLTPSIAVDGNGDVVIAGSERGLGIRKYDGALFDLPDGSAE